MKNTIYVFKFDDKNKTHVFKFDDKRIMSKINPKSPDIDSFKYSILISLHHYDIYFHPERIPKLKAHENKYNFTLPHD